MCFLRVCVGRVAGCLPVFSLAELHTAAWQQKAGQLNSLDGEKRARDGRKEEEEVRRKRRGGGTLRGHMHAPPSGRKSQFIYLGGSILN